MSSGWLVKLRLTFKSREDRLVETLVKRSLHLGPDYTGEPTQCKGDDDEDDDNEEMDERFLIDFIFQSISIPIFSFPHHFDHHNYDPNIFDPHECDLYKYDS